MKTIFILLTIGAATAMAQSAAPALAAAPVAVSNTAVDHLLDQIVAREHEFLDRLKHRAPLVETYIQEVPPASSADDRPIKDHYFLGRFRAGDTMAYEKLVERTDAPPKPASRIPLPHLGALLGSKPKPLEFLPRGFAQMAVLDLTDFNRQTYSFDYVRREFLGEIRCLVFDVAPRSRTPGRFTGRIWVEDRDNNIVRFDGIYVQPPPAKGPVPDRYFHFDSWRVNVAPGQWAPFEIYVEEEAHASKDGPGTPRFKAQTRIWDYIPATSSKLDELTSILIDADSGIDDPAASHDVSPLESQRSWERQAEDNIVARLEKGGLLAPPGPVDDVLNTVVNNLIVSAGLNIDAKCRVLLTTPLETFSIGHTVVISRGLIDVLPDEASLALVLAAELSHIALGHPTQTQFAFHNRTMLSDADLLQQFHFERSAQELDEAGRKTIEIMRASPYQKTANAGLFLKALAAREPSLPHLLAASLGNQLANPEALARLAAFAESAPALEEDKLEQIAALPLGSRVKLNPWNNKIELVKTRPLALLSPREKMPFEVTPFALYLVRLQ